MKRKMLASLVAPVFLAVVAPHHFEFPADHFAHPDFETEWWYYTGNLHDASGHRYGFELTFFRQAQVQRLLAASAPIWRADQIYLAHLALTDIDGHAFYHTERLNRTGPGLAGADLNARAYWNGNWRVSWKNFAPGDQQLQAVCDRFTLTLDLTPLKQAIINGENGVSRKGSALGDASYYVSFTRLDARGSLNNRAVSGLAWMDHEYFSPATDSSVAGWDWFAIQLDNNEELMLYRLRDKHGAVSPYSSGTFVDAQGAAHHLTSGQIEFFPGRTWSGYPIDWRIAIPSLDLELNERAALDDQELRTGGGPTASYWEGAVTYAGAIHKQAAHGVGYLELTGYRDPVRLGR